MPDARVLLGQVVEVLRAMPEQPPGLVHAIDFSLLAPLELHALGRYITRLPPTGHNTSFWSDVARQAGHRHACCTDIAIPATIPRTGSWFDRLSARVLPTALRSPEFASYHTTASVRCTIIGLPDLLYTFRTWSPFQRQHSPKAASALASMQDKISGATGVALPPELQKATRHP